MAKARTKRERRPKQPFLHPDMDPPRINDLDEAAETYYDVMCERCVLSKQEDEAKENLLQKMIQHGETLYTTPDGLVITLTSKSKVRVKKKGEEENGDGES